MSGSVVVLSGSPRQGGNTDQLVEAFAGGARAAEKQVAVFRTADLKIGGCLGCERCFREPGVCVQPDDMSPILAALRRADALVFASPVYYFGVTAQLKLAIDRLFVFLQAGLSVKRAALLMTCGDDSDGAARSSIGMFRQICGFLEWEEAGIVIAPRLHQPGEIRGRPELEQARSLGGVI